MTSINDKFTSLGNSIINLVGTRASKNMDNITTTGQNNIKTIVGGGIPPQSGQSGKFLTTDGASVSWGDAGGSRNIGEIVASTVPLTDAGLHLLDGALIDGAGIYSDFVSYMADLYGDGTDIPNYFCSEADWESSVVAYGTCDKYVYNSTNNTIRLPKRSTEHGKLIKSYSSGDNWYRIYEDGWCEQGSKYTKTTGGKNAATISLLKNFLSTDYSIRAIAISNGATVINCYDLQINSSNKTVSSFSIGMGPDSAYWTGAYWEAYGYIDISDYQHSPVYEYIVIATSTKTSIQVDIDEVATDLNGKADVDLTNMNASASAKNEVISWGRQFTAVNTVVESNLTGSTSATYDLGFTDNKVKMGHFAVYVGAQSSGSSGVCLTSDCFSNVTYTSHKTGCVLTNNGYSNVSYVYIPFITQITVAVKTVSSSQVLFIGYQ